MARMTGDLNIYKTIGAAREAIKTNKELIFKMLLVSIALTFTTVIPFSNIIQFIIVISLTLFSIDVYKVRFEGFNSRESRWLKNNCKIKPFNVYKREDLNEAVKTLHDTHTKADIEPLLRDTLDG